MDGHVQRTINQNASIALSMKFPNDAVFKTCLSIRREIRACQTVVKMTEPNRLRPSAR